MTERERELLNYLKDNPMISQAELAKKMAITRSSVSVHISNLMKKGYIKGKGYVLTEAIDDVVVVGGANMDLTGIMVASQNNADSNPGNISISMGGVGRNIAENLAHLGVNVYLLTAVGDDMYGHELIEKCQSLGINMSLTKTLNDYSTSVYMQILDKAGHLQLAVSDMDITATIKVEDMILHDRVLKRSKAIVVDGNVTAEVIQYLAENYGQKLFFEPVSMAKANKCSRCLDMIYCMTPNEQEAAVILDQPVDASNMVEALHAAGVTFPVVTYGASGVGYYDQGVQKLPAQPADIISVTGAGDALMAGLVYGFISGHSKQAALTLGTQLASKALETQDAVNMHIKYMTLEEE